MNFEHYFHILGCVLFVILIIRQGRQMIHEGLRPIKVKYKKYKEKPIEVKEDVIETIDFGV